MKGCNISIDRYLPPAAVTKWALRQELTDVGTRYRTEKEYQANSIEWKVEEPTMFVYDKNERMLASYSNRKAWKKFVLVSTDMMIL